MYLVDFLDYVSSMVFFTLKVLVITFAVAFLAACAVSPEYKTQRQYVPLLSQKGQVRLGLQASRGVGAHLAFSPAEHFGFAFQASRYFAGDLLDSSESNWMLQASGGYYSRLSHGLLFENYFVGGIGKTGYDRSDLFTPDPHPLSAHIWLAAVQPALGYKSKVFEWALSGRTGYIGYVKVRGQSTVDSVDMRASLVSHPHTLLFEPALTARIFSTYAGIEFQYGRSLCLSTPPLSLTDAWGSFALVWRIPGEEIPRRWRR